MGGVQKKKGLGSPTATRSKTGSVKRTSRARPGRKVRAENIHLGEKSRQGCKKVGFQRGGQVVEDVPKI